MPLERVIGCIAWRWLERFEFGLVKPWLIVTILSLPVLPVVLMISKQLNGFAGGWNIQAVLYAFWEPLVAWGVILGLLWQFQKRLSLQNRLSRWLAERSYAVFIIHPPVLVGISLALRPWGAPPFFKFLIAGSLACVGCMAAATLLLKVPGVRKVL